ncbi:MAG TPA: AtpZ/AtpI family protein [Candidatus Aminicenantes bacterium]|nr:AtpZ/AtpI family protein [Candidatus Aminicenantes bacterium]
MGSLKPKWRRLAELSSLGLILPSSIIVGLFFGYWLDKLFGTHPWLLLVFTVLGIASGLINLLRAVQKINKNMPPHEE